VDRETQGAATQDRHTNTHVERTPGIQTDIHQDGLRDRVSERQTYIQTYIH